MQIYGGYIAAAKVMRGGVINTILPLTTTAETDDEAFQKVAVACFDRFPSAQGFFNHSYGVAPHGAARPATGRR
jgi:hypothetical protein